MHAYHSVMQWVAVAFGGALGAMLRFWLATRVFQIPTMPAWPWATFLANATGSFLFGFLAVALASSPLIHDNMRLAVMTGLLGAFTTYSTFSFEVIRMLETHAYSLAVSYGLGSLIACVSAAATGLLLGRYFFE